MPRITSLRSWLRVLNNPANISFAFFCRSDSVPVMISEMAFCASSSGAARRKPRDQVLYRGVFLPSVPDVVNGRPCPHGGNGDFRHLDLTARPIGEARIGGKRRAPQGQFNGDRHGDGPTSHVPPPPGSPRRPRNPRAGSYARIAPTMNRAVHPPTTTSEIQLIWQ